MLTLIICFIIFIVSWILLFKKYPYGPNFLGLVLAVISFFVAFLSVAFPWNGYNDWILEEEIPLVQLKSEDFGRSDDKDSFYVYISADNQYYYCVERIKGIGTGEVREKVIEVESRAAQCIEDEGYEKPIVKIYSRRAKNSLWCMAGLLIHNETKVFYVPENGVISEFEINK